MRFITLRSLNSASGHVAAKFSTEIGKKTLVITKYQVRWLNWTNATPFRLVDQVITQHFSTSFMFFADLNLLDCQAWVVM